jgi:hypothetical protein
MSDRRNRDGQILDHGPDATERTKAQGMMDEAKHSNFRAPEKSNVARPSTGGPKRGDFPSGVVGQSQYAAALRKHNATVEGQKKGLKGS